MVDTTLDIQNDKGNCSAILTRRGFFDFVVFRTLCNVSHNVGVVCQHDKKVKDLNNNMSDIKISAYDGFYSLQAVASCDVGWFLIDNVCINFYECPDCSGNTPAHEECERYGGQLAYHVLSNVTITTPGNMLDKNTELSKFWGMFHHMDDISPSPKRTFKSIRNAVKEDDQLIFAVNGSSLCEALNMSNQCTDSNIALSVRNNYIQLEETVLTDFDSFWYMETKIVRINNINTSYVVPLWSVIYQPIFQMATFKHFALCEKPHSYALMFTNCSDLYMNCNDGTCVHDSLVCDGQQHCPHGEDEADCQHICSDHSHNCISQCHHRDLCSCSPEYFQCLSGGCVPLQKLCDKTLHCDDASDEPPTCVYLRPDQLGRVSLSLDINNYINKLIQQNIAIQQRCLKNNNESLFPLENVAYQMHFQQPRCSPSSLSPNIKFLCTIVGTPYIVSQQYFSLDHLCIYDHDCDDDYYYHCFNGFHLLKCEHMYCVGRFKCLSSYCISVDHICNKVCDCPHCEDESICSKLLCPGMVLIEQTGSGLRCSMKAAALKHSMNMRQIIHRKGINITDDFPVFIHLEGIGNSTQFIHSPELVVYCKIMHSKFTTSAVSVLHRMISVRRLLLPHNSIQNLYDYMFLSMSHLIVLDLSHNQLKYLSHIPLCALHNLQYISLHHNLIAELQVSIFVNNPSVQVLLLESNNMNPQSVIIDGSLSSLYRLSSDIPRLCCGFETVILCSPPFPLRVSCSNLIPSTALMVLGWLVGLTTSLLSFFCLVLLIYNICKPQTPTPKVVMFFSLNLTLAELATSLCLLSYSVINVVFHDVFGVIADQWRHSLKCLSLESLFSISSRSSLVFAVCLSIHFAIHIPLVIHRESNQKATFFQIMILWFVVTSIGIAVQILEHIHATDPFNYFCFPFTTKFPSDTLILSLQSIMLILDSFLVIATIASYGYLLVFTIRQGRNKALQPVGKRKEKLQKLGSRLTVLILSTVLTWIPILCVQILVLLQITVLPNIYFWCVLVSFPVNLIIDPILLIRTMLA